MPIVVEPGLPAAALVVSVVAVVAVMLVVAVVAGVLRGIGMTARVGAAGVAAAGVVSAMSIAGAAVARAAVAVAAVGLALELGRDHGQDESLDGAAQRFLSSSLVLELNGRRRSVNGPELRLRVCCDLGRRAWCCCSTGLYSQLV
jgi:hypothetical protein